MVPGAARLFGTEGGDDVVAWDLGSREAIVQLRGHRRFGTAALSGAPDGARVATAAARARPGCGTRGSAATSARCRATAAKWWRSRPHSVTVVTASLDGVIRGGGLVDGAVRRATRVDADHGGDGNSPTAGWSPAASTARSDAGGPTATSTAPTRSARRR